MKSAAETENRTGTPNILVIFTDDHAHWAMHCAGNSELHTPNLDFLAETGVRMVNAYTPSPVCSPARACFWTGRYPSQHGIHDYLHEMEIAKDFPGLAGQTTIAQLLQRGGYKTGLFGKWHCGQTDFPQPGFNRWFSNHSSRCPHRGDQRFSDEGEIVWRAGHSADFIVDEALSFIRQSNQQPFFAFVGMIDTHSPFNDHPERFVDKYRKATFQDIPDEAFNSIHGFDRLRRPSDPDLHREQLAQYYGAVSMVDHQVGRLLDGLDGLGLRESTLVVYTSDHGHMNGHHGLYTKGNATVPQNFLEESIRVPCILNWPGILPAGVEAETWVNHCDLYATLLQVSGVVLDQNERAEINSPGQSYLPFLTQGDAPAWVNKPMICEYGNARMIRRGDIKFIKRYPPHADCGDELYNLSEDPREEHNLLYGGRDHPAAPGLHAELDRFFGHYQDPARSGLDVMEMPRFNPSEPWRAARR